MKLVIIKNKLIIFALIILFNFSINIQVYVKADELEILNDSENNTENTNDSSSNFRSCHPIGASCKLILGRPAIAGTTGTTGNTGSIGATGTTGTTGTAGSTGTTGTTGTSGSVGAAGTTGTTGAEGTTGTTGTTGTSGSVGAAGTTGTTGAAGTTGTTGADGASGITTLNGDIGSATGTNVTIAGGSNINTSATASTVTINLDDSPSVSGSVTAGTGFTATTGDVVITAGNITIPQCTGSTQGSIQIDDPVVGIKPIFNTFSGGATGLQDGNTYCGYLSAASNFTQTGVVNTVYGAMAGSSFTNASGNTLIGVSAGQLITSATDCCLIGNEAGLNIDIGSQNVAVGSESLTSITSGTLNTAIGQFAGSGSISTGSRNVFVGHNTGLNYTSSESDNILVGPGISGTVGDNHTVRIGNQGSGTDQQNRCFIAGITGVTVTGTSVLCATNGQLGTISSSIKLKENVKDMGSESEILNKLRPVIFNFKSDSTKHKQWGLIAEEVHEVYPDLVLYDSENNNEPYSVRYLDIIPMLLNEYKKIRKELDELKKNLHLRQIAKNNSQLSNHESIDKK